MQQVPAEMEIKVSLQAQEWQIVMETLADGRYRLVGPLIQKLSQQFEQASSEAPSSPQLRTV